MSSFNKVILLGNLTRDVQLKFLPSQTACAEFGMAMNRKWKSQDGSPREEVVFVDCTAFGKQAEIINQYCQKGNQLMVEGRLKYDVWEDKTGGKRSKVGVVVENFQLMGSRPASESDDTDQRNDRPARTGNVAADLRGQQKASFKAAPTFDDDTYASSDIPF